MKNFKTTFCTALMVLVFATAGNAGVLMVSSHESYEPAMTSIIKAYIEKDKMRVETKGADGDFAFIFRGDKQVFWSIDYKNKTYVEITKEDLKRMKEQIQDAMKQMEEQMKNLPPEQRKLMEQMMQGQMKQQVQAPKVIYKKVASGVNVNKWSCDKYEGLIEGRKVRELWTTDWQKLDLSAEDFKVMQDMAEFFKEFSESVASSFYQVGNEDWERQQGYRGVPVREIHYSGSKLLYKTELMDVKKVDFAPTSFEVPAGFKKEKIQRGK